MEILANEKGKCCGAHWLSWKECHIGSNENTCTACRSLEELEIWETKAKCQSQFSGK